MPETSVLYDPGLRPIEAVRTSPAKSLLRPGELALVQNMRWGDSGVLTARGGTLAMFTLPTSLSGGGGADVVDMWAGELNGSQYVVIAYEFNSKIEIWVSEAGAAPYRLSEVGGSFGGTTGDTRFTTLTGRVVFQPVKTPRYSILGSAIASKDVLIISNGTDRNYVWTPTGTQTTIAVSGATNATPIRITTSASHNLNDGDTVVISGVLGNTAANGSWWVDRQSATTFDLYSNEALSTGVAGNGAYTSGGTVLVNLRYALHKSLSVPADWKMFSQTATMRDFWQVATAAATHTYGAGGLINQARWNLADTTAAPYNAGTNVCILFTLTTAAAAGDIAHVYFSGDQLNMNRAIGFLLEGTTAAIDRFLSRSKIEAGKENVTYASVSTWSTIYDPSGTAEKQRKGDLIPVDATNNRYMVFFPTDHITTADRTAYHLRFTYDGAAPTANTTITILAIMGSGDIPGGATCHLSYEDRFSYVESFGIEPIFTGTAKFEDLGGPDSYTGGKREELLPNDTDVLYDYALTIPNSQGADNIEGGLNGEPSHFNIYLKLASEDTPIYFYCVTMYSAGAFTVPFIGNGWLKQFTGLLSFVHNTSSMTGSYAADESDRDPFREVPTAWQIAIPPFLASTFANSRLFFGNVYDLANAKRQEGAVYFSWKANPFRNQDIIEPLDVGVYDERSGGRDEYAGESVQSLVPCAAQAAGRSMVHVHTTRSFNVQGFAGGFVGTADEASSLGTHTRISHNGTNAHRTVAESNGRIMWLDQLGAVMEYYQGGLRDVSRQHIDDKPTNIPAGLISDAAAIIHKNRYLLGYAIANGNNNARLAVFHFLKEAWEAVDLPPLAPQRMVLFYDTTVNGTGQRLLIATTQAGVGGGGNIYEYDKASTNDLGTDIAIKLTFAEYMENPAGHTSLILKGVWLAVDAQSQTWTIDRTYRHQTGVTRSTVSLSTGRLWDQGRPTVISGFADGRGERGMAVFLDISGNMTASTSLWDVGCELKCEATDDAPVGN